MKNLRSLVLWMLVFCLPLFFVSTTIRWLASEIRLYEYGFSKYEISKVTKIDNADLSKVARQLIDYFNGRVATPQVTVQREGKAFNIFNQKELIHLEDVKGLMQLAFFIQIVVLTIIIAGVLTALKPGIGWLAVLRGFFWGSVATCALMLGFLLIAVFGFDQFFILFHLVSFSNDLWILDPSKDYLIMLFPEGFFSDAALFWFVAVLVEAIATGGIAFGVLRSMGWRRETPANQVAA